MNSIERRGIDPDDPKLRSLLARHAFEAIEAGIYVSYLCAVDQHHGGRSDNKSVDELQAEKSAFARSEYPLIPYFWTIYKDDGVMFQDMLELNKIDPDTGNHPILYQHSSHNGLHVIDGSLLVAIFNAESAEVWRNKFFDESQSELLFNHAREIETFVRE